MHFSRPGKPKDNALANEPEQRTNEIPISEYNKYNQKKLLRVDFSDLGISALRRSQQLHRGLPGFMLDLLTFEKNPPQRLVANAFPETVAWNKEGTFVLSPNGTYSSELHGIAPAKMREAKHGFALCGWFIHPSALEQTVFRYRSFRDNYGNTLDPELGIFQDTALSISRKDRCQSQRRNHEVALAYGRPYLASPLDLTDLDIDWLRGVRAMIMQKLESIYRLDPTDLVDIYLHDLYLEDCSTLHVHVRVNRAAHPLDARCRIQIDQAINELTVHGSLHQIYYRNGTYKRTLNVDSGGMFDGIQGLKFTTIRSSKYLLETNVATNAAGVPFRDLLLGPINS